MKNDSLRDKFLFFLVSTIVTVTILVSSPTSAGATFTSAAFSEQEFYSFPVWNLMVCGLHTETNYALRAALAVVNEVPGWKKYIEEGTCETAQWGTATTTGRVVQHKFTGHFFVVEVRIDGEVAYVIVPEPKK